MSEHEKFSWGFGNAIVLVCIILFVTWAAIPNFVNRNRTSPANACINNLRQIDAAANEFALENHLTVNNTLIFPVVTQFQSLNLTLGLNLSGLWSKLRHA